jgi:hypothetical protein
MAEGKILTWMLGFGASPACSASSYSQKEDRPANGAIITGRE